MLIELSRMWLTKTIADYVLRAQYNWECRFRRPIVQDNSPSRN